MSEIYQKDESIHEPTTAHIHPLETTPQGSQADHAEGSHEHRDVEFGALGKWFLGLFIGIFLSFVAMIFFFNWGLGLARQHDSKPSAMWTQRPELKSQWPDPQIVTPVDKPGAIPALQPYPEDAQHKFRDQEDETLEMYDWAKDEKGHKTGAVTIPIERAIELTGERGLPEKVVTDLKPARAQAEVVRPSRPH